MTPRSHWHISLTGLLPALLLVIAFAGCGSGGGGSKGTCRTAGGCGDDFTHAQCDLINGTFGKGKSCVVQSGDAVDENDPTDEQ